MHCPCGDDAASADHGRFADLPGVAEMVAHDVAFVVVHYFCEFGHQGYWLGMSADTLPGNEGDRFSIKA